MDQTFSNVKQNCDTFIKLLKKPEIASLPENSATKQVVLLSCGMACGDDCPSAAAKDRALGQFTEIQLFSVILSPFDRTWPMIYVIG